MKKLRRSSRGVKYVCSLLLISAAVLGIPAAAAAITWPTTFNPVGDCGESEPAGDKSPSQVDLVGSAGANAAFVQVDSSYLYLRERIAVDPSGPGGFASQSWVVLVQTPTGNAFQYQYLISVDGGAEEVQLWQNDAGTASNISFSPIFNDPAETMVFSDSTANLARIVSAGTSIGGNPNFFVDWAIPISVLTANGIDPNLSLYWFATSANSNNYNKDTLNCPFTPTTTLDLTKSVSPNQIGTGPNAVTYTITVTNSGTYLARGVVVTDNDFPSWLVINNVTTTAGTATFTASSFEVDIDNLAIGASATITVSATANSLAATTFTNTVNAFATNSSGGSASTLLSVTAPTATPTRTGTPTLTPTSTPVGVPLPSATNTPTQTSTVTATSTATETATSTATSTLSPTQTLTASPTQTTTPQPTNTPTETATSTGTPTVTPTPSITATGTETPTPTATQSPTGTPCGQVLCGTLPPSATPTATPTPLFPLDHFTCYAGQTTRRTQKFLPILGVSVADAFTQLTVDVRRTKVFCLPTNRDNTDPAAPAHADQLHGYLTRKSKGTPKFVKVRNQEIDTPLGNLFVDLLKPARLFVPSAKSLISPPPEPVPGIDHFSCYKVRQSTSSPPFVAIPGVNIQDQFGTLVVDVRRPTMMCAPAKKLNEAPGAENHPNYLMCFKVRRTKGSVKFTKKSPVYTSNQFGAQTLDLKRPAELCVPALHK